MTSDFVTLESLSLNSVQRQATISQLVDFRQQLYHTFDHRGDAIISLIDALCSNTSASSVAQLSLNSRFDRSYNSIYDAIEHFFIANDMATAKAERERQEQRFIRLISNSLSEEKGTSFVLFSVDVTSTPRRFAKTLKDRGYVYAPNTIASNKPVTIGHQYSALVLHPQKKQPSSPPWVVPLSMVRVTTDEAKQVVGAKQLQALLCDETLPFGHQLWLRVVYFVNHCSGCRQPL